jgi:hypothetical protein
MKLENKHHSPQQIPPHPSQAASSQLHKSNLYLSRLLSPENNPQSPYTTTQLASRLHCDTNSRLPLPITTSHIKRGAIGFHFANPPTITIKTCRPTPLQLRRQHRHSPAASLAMPHQPTLLQPRPRRPLPCPKRKMTTRLMEHLQNSVAPSWRSPSLTSK